MGLEHYPLIGCPVQTAEGMYPERFLVLGKMSAVMQSLPEAVQEFAPELEEPPDGYPMTIPFDPREMTAGTPTDTTYGELKRIWEGYERRFHPICSGCPMNTKRSPIGCYAAMTYPITETGEKWLMSNFNPPEGAMGFIPYHIREWGITGANLDGDRPEGIMAARTPVSKVMPDGSEITGSQIIEFLFECQPEMLPITLFHTCISFGAVDLQGQNVGEITMILLILQNTGGDMVGEVPAADWKRDIVERSRFLLTSSPDEERSVFKFKQFLGACWWTFGNNGSLFIDG